MTKMLVGTCVNFSGSLQEKSESKFQAVISGITEADGAISYEVVVYDAFGIPKVKTDNHRPQDLIPVKAANRSHEVMLFEALSRAKTALHIRCLNAVAIDKIRVMLADNGIEQLFQVESDLLVCPVPEEMVGELAISLLKNCADQANATLSEINSEDWFESLLQRPPFTTLIREIPADSTALYGCAPLSAMSLPPMQLSDDSLNGLRSVPTADIRAKEIEALVSPYFESKDEVPLLERITKSLRWLESRTTEVAIAVPEFPFFQTLAIAQVGLSKFAATNTDIENEGLMKAMAELTEVTLPRIKGFLDEASGLTALVDELKGTMGFDLDTVRFTVDAKIIVAKQIERLDVQSPPFCFETELTDINSAPMQWFVKQLIKSVDMNNVTADTVLLDLTLWIRLRDFAANSYARFYVAVNELCKAFVATPNLIAGITSGLLEALFIENAEVVGKVGDAKIH